MRLDPEKTARIKRAGVILVGAVVVGLSGYAYGSSSARPEMVAISQTGCGTSANSFAVPLATIKRGAPKLAASYGPMEIPKASSVQFKFDPEADGKRREVNLVADTLHLPITFGAAGVVPERIRVNCRDGAIATIRYETGSRNSQTFAVVRYGFSLPDPES